MIVNYPQVISIENLKPDVKFLVSYMEQIRTRYGGKLLVHLLEDENEYSVELPPIATKPFYKDPQLLEKCQRLLEKGKLCITFRKPKNSIVEFGELE